MKRAYLSVIVAVVIIAASVGGFEYYQNTQNTGHMSISVADAPIASGVAAVYIEFKAVSLHSNTSGWQNYSANETLNIWGLTISNASLLANISLHPGTYTMIRLYITSVIVNILGVNFTFTLNAPFAFINHPFTISAHSTTAVTVEFDLNADLNLQSKVFTPNVGFTVTS